MKSLLVALSLLLAIQATAAEPPVRKTKDLRGLPIAPLRQMVKPHLFRALLISPVEAWVTLKGHVGDQRFSGARVTYSELNSKYDDLALEMVKLVKFRWGWETELGTHMKSGRVRFDLLVYKIKDGRMAIGFVQSDEPEGPVSLYNGPALMAFERDGKWKMSD